MAGNDRIIYKGKIYGNTITTENSIIVTAPDVIDENGTEIYTVELPDEVNEVEITGGGRVKYGTSDIHTVVC